MTADYFGVIDKYRSIYAARKYKTRFIPIEKIAKNPGLYGYSFDPIQTRARQQEFINSDKKINALIAANRCGKTECGAIKAINICLNAKKGDEFWILTESFDLQKSGVQKKLMMYLKDEDIVYAEKIRPNVLRSLELKNGCTIEFKTFEQGFAKLQSAKLIGAWIDEEPPENVYEEVYLRTVDMRGQIILTFTPRRGRTWSYDKIFAHPSDNKTIFNWGMEDNPFIPRDEIEFLKKTWSAKKVRMCLFGEYVSSDGAVFDTFDRQIHVREMGYNATLPTFVSVDWGVRFTDIGFYQYNRSVDEHYLIDHKRLEGAGYKKVMQFIQKKPYNIDADNLFCDPAGSARSQATKSGVSLLHEIEDEFKVRFNYVRSVGIEESIALVEDYFMSSDETARFFIRAGLDDPCVYLENYVRDEKTNEAIKDGVNDHFCDQMRYYFVNMIKRNGQSKWSQR